MAAGRLVREGRRGGQERWGGPGRERGRTDREGGRATGDELDNNKNEGERERSHGKASPEG